ASIHIPSVFRNSRYVDRARGADMSPDVLRISELTRRYGAVLANDDISLRVSAAEIVGLLGHNGAGKSTLVSQVWGLVMPHAGQILLGDTDAVRHPAAARRHVALQPQSQTPIGGLTPRPAIQIAGRLRGLSRRDARRSAEDLAEELDIGPWLDRRALPEGAGLSGWIRRLTEIGRASWREPSYTSLVDARRVVKDVSL